MTSIRSVLVLAPLFPWPPRDGGRIGILFRIRELYRHGIGVRLGYTYLPREDPSPSALDEWCEVVEGFARPQKGRDAWRSGRYPYGVGSRYLRPVRDWLKRQIMERCPDAVVLEQTQMGVYRHHIPEGIPVLLGVHNLEYRTLAGRAKGIGWSPRGLLYRAESFRMRRYEDRLRARDDWASLLFVSREERVATEKAFPHLKGRCVDLPPGCDPPPEPRAVGSRPRNLAFIGALWFENNTEGLLWFLREVWPRVRTSAPNASLTVAGHGAPSGIEALLRGTPGVRYLGAVPEVQPVYDGARGVILPIRVGGGVKVKTVEALGSGLPCVGTRHAYEGIPVDLSQACICSDDPAVLAEGARRILEADPDMLAMGRRAGQLVREELSWAAVGRRYVETLDNVVAAGRRELADSATRKVPTTKNT